VIDYIKNKDYVFIASKYEILQKFYDQTAPANSIIVQNAKNFKYSFKTLHLSPECKLIASITIREPTVLYNGEDLTFKSLYNETLILTRNETEYIKLKRINGYYPIMPANFLTVHKSQGRNIKNVIACVDDLFGMSMLYTQITRAMENLYFYTSQPEDCRTKIIEKVSFRKEFTQLNCLLNKLVM
jgi:hypothetical protein